MEDDAKSFLKRLTGFSLGPIISAFISFITVPVTTYFVAPEDFGKAAMYTLGFSISSLFIFLGLDQAFVREYNEQKNKSQLFWNSIILPLFFSLIVGAIYMIFYQPISKLMFGSVEGYIIIILAISLPFAVIDRFNMLVLRMEEKARIYSLFSIINKLLTLFIMIPYLIFIDASFKGIINATFINLVVICIIEMFFVRHMWKSKFSINIPLINTLLRFALPFLPAAIIGWFFTSMDNLALSQWSTHYELGVYSAAYKIVTVLTLIQSTFSTFWAPTAYRWHENKVSKDKYEKVSRMLLASMSLVFAFLVLFKDLIIKLLDARYVTAASSVPFLLFFPIMYTVSETTTLGIPFSRKTSYNIIISLVSALVNYIGNYLLVPKYGAMGASIATAIAYITFFWMRTLISRRLWFKFNLGIYVINTVLLFLLSFLSITINNFLINSAVITCIVYVNRNSIREIIDIVKPIVMDLWKKFRSKKGSV